MSESRVCLLDREEMRQRFIALSSETVFYAHASFYGELLKLAGREVGSREIVLFTALAFAQPAPSPLSFRDHYRAMIGKDDPVLEEALESMERIANLMNQKRNGS